jgi:hypothetical protein
MDLREKKLMYISKHEKKIGKKISMRAHMQQYDGAHMRTNR